MKNLTDQQKEDIENCDKISETYFFTDASEKVCAILNKPGATCFLTKRLSPEETAKRLLESTAMASRDLERKLMKENEERLAERELKLIKAEEKLLADQELKRKVMHDNKIAADKAIGKFSFQL